VPRADRPPESPPTETPPQPDAGSSVVRQEVPAQWSGPLAPPATLRAVDDIVENGAERVFTQFETEAGHRRELERYLARRHAWDKRIAQCLAGGFAFTALAVAAYAVSVGAYATASIIGGGSIAMVVAAFLGTALQRDP
jgi:uncharacterized membrane protein